MIPHKADVERTIKPVSLGHGCSCFSRQIGYVKFVGADTGIRFAVLNRDYGSSQDRFNHHSPSAQLEREQRISSTNGGSLFINGEANSMHFTHVPLSILNSERPRSWSRTLPRFPLTPCISQSLSSVSKRRCSGWVAQMGFHMLLPVNREKVLKFDGNLR